MILTYREGCSGSWLAELITLGNKESQVYYRQDRAGPRSNFPENVFHFDGNNDHQTVQARREYASQLIITCHSTNYPLLNELWPSKRILRIRPVTGIYQCITSSFHKMDVNHNSVSLAIEYIKDYYNLHVHVDRQYQQVVDYGMLCDLQYTTNLCKDMFGVELRTNHINFFNKYWDMQKYVVDDKQLYPAISKQTLLGLFSKENSVFNLACFIFIYEQLNNLLESQRTWSIDNVPNTLVELAEIMLYE